MTRKLVAISALTFLGLSLAGCNTGPPPGVLPRTDVPPPPSITGRDSRGGRTAATRPSDVTPRRAVAVPSTMSTPAPSSAVTPVMTGTGVGAGFKF